MYLPATDDEITGIAGYLQQQLAALRASALGLTDDQLRMQPCTSALSVGGLLKHVTQGMGGATARLTGNAGEPPTIDDDAVEAYMAAFTMRADETGTDVLAAFDAAREPYLAAVRASDPSAPSVEPPSPWFGVYDSRPANVRFYLVHQIEEMARHAGHADILREQIDGVLVPAVQMTQEGMQANQFFTPYVPQPGTLGAAQA